MLDIIKVVWVDSRRDSDWMHKENFDPGVSLCQSIGFQVAATKQYVSVAGSVADAGDKHEQYSDVMNIPRVCIISITRLSPIALFQEENKWFDT
jgi:hypothetical protein